MKLQHISYDLAAVVAAQVKAGKSLDQIARAMHISVQTAAGAFSRWSLLQRESAKPD
ncbi:MAG TPA: hypothetical protein VNT75_10075 [Symbiobacteriaceae bacterium]|nr:hypothetical protein [Symbiobacteriaceae bacterium]